LWEADKPTQFDETFLESVTSAIKENLKADGWFTTRFKVSVEPSKDGGKGILNIHIEHEGARAIIGKIDVKGAKKNPPMGS